MSGLVAVFRGAMRRLSLAFDAERREVARAFDAAWYRRTYPDVAASGVDLLDHYLEFGWREGRDPSPRFSTLDYLAAYPGLLEAGINPLVHSLKHRGRAKVEVSPLGFRHPILERLEPMEARIALARQGAAAADPDSTLQTALAGAAGGLQRLHVTFSHDDYAENLGGVQLALLREAAGVAAQGRDHLHLFPATPWPVVRAAGEKGLLGVRLNGRRVGVFPARVIAAALRTAAGPRSGAARSFAIHSLLGHSVAETLSVLSALGLKRGAFWLHDFASLCAGFHLLRNDVEDCGAPPPSSAACAICVYGPERRRHLDAHAALFAKLQLTVVSPSQSALDLWRAASDLPVAGTLVHPHARLRRKGPAPLHKDNRLRVAYAGLPAAHKGWQTFVGLVAAYADDPRYEFHHLGHAPALAGPVRFHPAAVSPKDPLAMQRALQAAQADVLLVWPLCRETFSFVTFEAAAAGCAVITNPDSGNVAAAVAEHDLGLVLADEAALHAAFETGDVLALARAVRRPSLAELEFSALTADLIREEPSA